MTTRIEHDAKGTKYEILVDEVAAGHVKYRLDEGVIDFTHTEVDDAYQGQGLAGVLVQGALDDVRDTTELRVVATCPYVRGWLEKHPEYASLTTR